MKPTQKNQHNISIKQQKNSFNGVFCSCSLFVSFLVIVYQNYPTSLKQTVSFLRFSLSLSRIIFIYTYFDNQTQRQWFFVCLFTLLINIPEHKTTVSTTLSCGIYSKIFDSFLFLSPNNLYTSMTTCVVYFFNSIVPYRRTLHAW